MSSQHFSCFAVIDLVLHTKTGIIIIIGSTALRGPWPYSEASAS
jgi:hypothetical protein